MTTTKRSGNRKTAGKIDLLEGALDPKAVKWRVTMFLDLDVLDHIRAEADSLGIGYQTRINEILREHIEGKALSLADRLEALERAVFAKGA